MEPLITASEALSDFMDELKVYSFVALLMASLSMLVLLTHILLMGKKYKKMIHEKDEIISGCEKTISELKGEVLYFKIKCEEFKRMLTSDDAAEEAGKQDEFAEGQKQTDEQEILLN